MNDSYLYRPENFFCSKKILFRPDECISVRVKKAYRIINIKNFEFGIKMS